MKNKRAPKGSSNQFKATEGKQLTEQQIEKFIEFFNNYGTVLGNKIVCNATGKLTTCVGPWKDKKIKEYGGIENLLRNYKRKESTPKSSNKSATEVIVYKFPPLKYEPKPMTQKQLTEETKSACLRPDIYLTNGRHCDGCNYIELCQSRLKRLPSYSKIS